MSVRLVFETRAKCRDFVARHKDDGIPCEIDSPFCSVKTTITVRQSRSIEDPEIGKQFAPLWRVLADHLEILFPDGDDEGAFIVPALDTRSQVLSIEDRRNGVGKPVFKLAPLGSGHDNAALEEMPCNAHRVHVYHSQREGLSVGQSSSVSERMGTRCGKNRETCCGKWSGAKR